MITRAKYGTIKIKTYYIALSDFNTIEPKLIKHALQDPHWKASMATEYKALNKTTYGLLFKLQKIDLSLVTNGFFESRLYQKFSR